MCSSVLSQSWISPEKMPFVVEERGKDNIVPVELLSRERLVCISITCVIGNGQGNASPHKQRRKGKQDVVYKLNRDLLRNQGKRSSNTSEAIQKCELLHSPATRERLACSLRSSIPYRGCIAMFVVLTFKL